MYTYAYQVLNTFITAPALYSRGSWFRTCFEPHNNRFVLFFFWYAIPHSLGSWWVRSTLFSGAVRWVRGSRGIIIKRENVRTWKKCLTATLSRTNPTSTALGSIRSCSTLKRQQAHSRTSRHIYKATRRYITKGNQGSLLLL